MLAIDAWQLNTSGTEIQQLSIAWRQDRLQSQLEGLVASATQVLGEDWDDDVELDTTLQFQDDQADGEEIENPFVLPTQGNAETMPSYIGIDHLQELGLGFLVEQELSLRQGQANDCLHEIRLALADKAIIFR